MYPSKKHMLPSTGWAGCLQSCCNYIFLQSLYQSGNPFQANLLQQCYTNSINFAYKHGLSSIAFPLISSGIYGYPQYEALYIAVSSIFSALQTYGSDSMVVTLCLLNPELYQAAHDLYASLTAHISDIQNAKR